VGAIMNLQREDEPMLTVSVEYNQIDALLKDSGKDGDVNDPSTGFSPFPGSINQLLLRMDDYVGVLDKTEGMMPEFVNPKYKDPKAKTDFKKPTRLETMMQDYPRMLAAGQTAGFTAFTGMHVFSPVKNGLEGARAKVAAGLPAHSAATGEDDMYASAYERLTKLGVQVGEPKAQEFDGIPVVGWPKISLPPALGPDSEALRSVFPSPDNVRITSDSTLKILCPAPLSGPRCGAGLIIENLDLDGHMEITVNPDVAITVRNLKVHNEGSHFQAIGDEQKKTLPEMDLLRGYTLERANTDEGGAYKISLQSPGKYVVSDNGVLQEE